MSERELVVSGSLKRSGAVEVLPDSERYKCRFKVKSASSNRLYLISYDSGPGWWTCSCRGNIRHGQCKHLTAAGLKGRKFGSSKITESEIYRQLNYQEVKQITC